MRKFSISFIAALLLCLGAVTTTSAHMHEVNAEGEMAQIELTDKQVKDLEKTYKKILKNNKELITKYVKYGVFTEEKGNMLMAKFEEHYEMLKENDFIPVWDRHKHQQEEQE